MVPSSYDRGRVVQEDDGYEDRPFLAKLISVKL